jgi:acetate kinase
MTRFPRSDNPVLLVLNPGSSSIKWSVHNAAVLESQSAMEPIVAGQTRVDHSNARTHFEAAELLTRVLENHDVRAVIVRVVHGGSEYLKPVSINDDNFRQLQNLIALAPLHNEAAIELIDQLRHSRISIPIVAVFDSEYFSDLPMVSQSYGLPAALIKKYRLRRYGFHGFAHESMVTHWETINPDTEHFTLVTAQLGSGCSMVAIRDGKPVDTTMGYTPNEGLLMRTRSGEIDPGLLTWLQRQERWSPEETDYILNHDSGWRGLSGGIDNMADLFASEQPQHQLAFELFRYRFQKTLGAYFAILGGLDGIVLSGGIAENNVDICRRLLSGLSHLGIALEDPVASFSLPLFLSSPVSPVQCWVVAADEAAAMLRSVHHHFSFENEFQSLAD